MTTGEKIKLARKAAKMTQRELSEKTGIAEPTIRKYESDRLNPKYNTLVTFANALGVRMAYFLNEKTPEEILNMPERVDAIAFEMNIAADTIHKVLNSPFKYSEYAVSILTVNALLDEIHERDAIEKKLGYALVMELNPQKGFSDRITQMAKYLDQLNERGQQIAMERVLELTKISDYQRKDDDT